MRGFLKLASFTIVVMTWMSGLSQAHTIDSPAPGLNEAAPLAALAGPSLGI